MTLRHDAIALAVEEVLGIAGAFADIGRLASVIAHVAIGADVEHAAREWRSRSEPTFAALRATPRLVEGDAAGAEASDRETEVAALPPDAPGSAGQDTSAPADQPPAVLIDDDGTERPWWWCATHVRAEQTAADATCSWNGPYDSRVEAEAAP